MVTSQICQYERQVDIYREMLDVAREQQRLCIEANLTRRGKFGEDKPVTLQTPEANGPY